jgi:EcoRII C terminal
MQWGDLRTVFRGVAWKRLSAHEVDPTVSHGHEFQGVQVLRQLIGTQDHRFAVTYMLLSDDTDNIESIRSEAQWYDSRANQPHRSAEWRLYYPADVWQIQTKMRAGDLMVMAVTKSGELVVMLASAGSTRESQLRALFNIDEAQLDDIEIRTFDGPEALGFVAASILDELGFARGEAPKGEDSDLAQRLAMELSRTNPLALPPGQQVSALVRSRVPQVDTLRDPDGALLRWIETEEALFRSWEDGVVVRRLNDGFVRKDGTADVAGYREFSMSLRQSRVSRAGTALEQHFAQILRDHQIRFESRPSIDGGERPDFLFPGKAEYDDASFPASQLRMLAVKFTAKDRWRQVLNEAIRIKRKHLLTLEAPISARQLALMDRVKLQLVIPLSVQEVYPKASRAQLISVDQFLHEMKALQ